MLHANLSVGEQGHLLFAGVDTTDLAKTYGTALYVLDENRIRENCRAYTRAMKQSFCETSVPLYASKALCFKGIYPIIEEEGMYIDVVSLGELFTAQSAGFPLARAFFHGNNKTPADIDYAMEQGIGFFIVDNPAELARIEQTAAQKNKTQDILLRLTPGIDPHTFAAVNTGKVDSKFGVAIETGQAAQFLEAALNCKHLNVRGLHCHVGSQVFDIQSFVDASAIMLQFIADMAQKLGFSCEMLDLGGGFGSRYVQSDPTVTYADLIRELSVSIKAQCAARNLRMPAILLEPGRSIVADAGITLYTVGSVKTIPGYKSYVAIDGGMTDNPRYALYGAAYTAITANRANQPADFCCTIAGNCCESGDLIQEDVYIAKPQAGDLIAVLTTGAYNFSMASNYNRMLRPAVVMIKDGKSRLVVRRETLFDLLACDL